MHWFGETDGVVLNGHKLLTGGTSYHIKNFLFLKHLWYFFLQFWGYGFSRVAARCVWRWWRIHPRSQISDQLRIKAVSPLSFLWIIPIVLSIFLSPTDESGSKRLLPCASLLRHFLLINTLSYTWTTSNLFFWNNNQIQPNFESYLCLFSSYNLSAKEKVP